MNMNSNNDIQFYKKLGPYSISEIAREINAVIYKDTTKIDIHATKHIAINSIHTLTEALDSDVAFFNNRKHISNLNSTKAVACITSVEHINVIPKNIYALQVDNVKAAYVEVIKMFFDLDEDINNSMEGSYIHPSAKIGANCKIFAGSYISENVTIGDNVTIMPNSYIGKSVKIGNKCFINSLVSIVHSIIGESCTIHSGAKIGQDGFGYTTVNDKHIKVPQVGRVIIGNDVEIGANTTIDRGALGDTVIGNMCKLDNLVQIGHNVEMGIGCIVVAQVGVSGSTKLGNYVVIGGQAGIADNLMIGDQVQIGAQSGVMKNIKPKEVVLGYPSEPIKDFFRERIAMKKIIKHYMHK